MILYTVTGKVGNEGYCDISKSGDLTGKNIYVNMTNKCPCNCVFCLRHIKDLREDSTLWLKDGEPDVESVLSLFAEYDLDLAVLFFYDRVVDVSEDGLLAGLTVL